MLPLQELGFNLNKREFRDAVKQHYYWPVEDIPSTCARGKTFTVDQSMICKLGGFITQRHNELRDLSEISRGGGGVEKEGGSQLFETQKREGS